MPNPNKLTKTKQHYHSYHCAQLSYTTQKRTVLTIFPLI